MGSGNISGFQGLWERGLTAGDHEVIFQVMEIFCILTAVVVTLVCQNS